ncbi:hypothetical protein TBLA_0J00850 [Henningerozyma blattae CBS 6284]|uniref:hydroxyacylglutathione hydrolase n=1 Tax=Henningerozyma blattae (strain ATCC 34711 / CBS 6284 / DSM 70876 / NBRC 10599 / NRRL Y-10934 / UCD 77-7) TaxID=1071380 RepID=I2H9N1_HENB6|nr:hypothetical protein TBLA_0J00850 [Tetrapisispora blattae CBS 6284]CCH63083.1 hypothetical protein TBLA_0J00850 [Tetrapisispora blattae CBS 6284]
MHKWYHIIKSIVTKLLIIFLFLYLFEDALFSGKWKLTYISEGVDELEVKEFNILKSFKSPRTIDNLPNQIDLYEPSMLKSFGNMTIKSIKMRWNTGGVNYSYLISGTNKQGDVESVLIDPAEANEIIEELNNEELQSIQVIANTHHHYDHAGGNLAMIKYLIGLDSTRQLKLIVGSETKDSAISKYSKNVKLEVAKDGDSIAIADSSIDVKFIRTPCHTQDSVCYHVSNKDTKDTAIFTGDTLFTGGCGRFFEGTGQEMDAAINKKLTNFVPRDSLKHVKVFPGHEYTNSNIKFIRKRIYDKPGMNDALDKLERYMEINECSTGIFSLKDEMDYNPFMRIDDPIVRTAVGDKDASWTRAQVMDKLRIMKNSM